MDVELREIGKSKRPMILLRPTNGKDIEFVNSLSGKEFELTSPMIVMNGLMVMIPFSSQKECTRCKERQKPEK